METITIASTRGSMFSEPEILLGIAVVIAIVAWMVFKHFRNRDHHEPRV